MEGLFLLSTVVSLGALVYQRLQQTEMRHTHLSVFDSERIRKAN